MDKEHGQKSYRTNPVEVVFLGVMGALFLSSVYNLFFTERSFIVKVDAPNRPVIKERASETAREPASTTLPTESLELTCEPKQARMTSVSRVRLQGLLCGGTKNGALLEGRIVNEATHTEGLLVVSDPTRFASDFVPLNLGRNPVKLVFQFTGGKKVALDLELTRLDREPTSATETPPTPREIKTRGE